MSNFEINPLVQVKIPVTRLGLLWLLGLLLSISLFSGLSSEDKKKQCVGLFFSPHANSLPIVLIFYLLPEHRVAGRAHRLWRQTAMSPKPNVFKRIDFATS